MDVEFYELEFQMGHRSSILDAEERQKYQDLPPEMTHSWYFYIQMLDERYSKKIFEKIVVNLHETFKNPRRVFRNPPYRISEFGYGSFQLSVEFYLRSPPSKQSYRMRCIKKYFIYKKFDYLLQLTEPSQISNSRVESFKIIIPTFSESISKAVLSLGAYKIPEPEVLKQHSRPVHSVTTKKKVVSQYELGEKHPPNRRTSMRTAAVNEQKTKDDQQLNLENIHFDSSEPPRQYRIPQNIKVINQPHIFTAAKMESLESRQIFNYPNNVQPSQNCQFNSSFRESENHKFAANNVAVNHNWMRNLAAPQQNLNQNHSAMDPNGLSSFQPAHAGVSSIRMLPPTSLQDRQCYLIPNHATNHVQRPQKSANFPPGALNVSWEAIHAAAPASKPQVVVPPNSQTSANQYYEISNYEAVAHRINDRNIPESNNFPETLPPVQNLNSRVSRILTFSEPMELNFLDILERRSSSSNATATPTVADSFSAPVSDSQPLPNHQNEAHIYDPISSQIPRQPDNDQLLSYSDDVLGFPYKAFQMLAKRIQENNDSVIYNSLVKIIKDSLGVDLDENFNVDLLTLDRAVLQHLFEIFRIPIY